jgi:CubicO group peptidase (beta-lactamase class C family)
MQTEGNWPMGESRETREFLASRIPFGAQRPDVSGSLSPLCHFRPRPMKFRDQTRSCWLVIALLVLTSRARAQSNDNATLPARVDSIASAVLASTGVPSATVAVVTHGQLAYAQAYGTAKLEPRLAATPDMRYGIGSISKQFTAACVLLLQQEGKLSLDDNVAKYIPGLTRGN